MSNKSDKVTPFYQRRSASIAESIEQFKFAKTNGLCCICQVSIQDDPEAMKRNEVSTYGTFCNDCGNKDISGFYRNAKP